MVNLLKAAAVAGGSGTFSPLDMSGLKYYVDIGDSNSYPGSGTKVYNIAPEGAEPDMDINGTFSVDGSGTNSGILGVTSCYLDTDAALDTFMRDLHNNNSIFTAICVYLPGATSGTEIDLANNDRLWATGSPSDHGAGLSFPSGDYYRFDVNGNAVVALTEHTNNNASDDTDWKTDLKAENMPMMVGVRFDEAAGAGGSDYWQNHTSYGAFDGTLTSPSTNNSAGLGILARRDGSNGVNDGVKFHAFLCFDRILTDVEMTQLWDFYRPRISTPGAKELWRCRMNSVTDDGNDWTVNQLEWRISTVAQTITRGLYSESGGSRSRTTNIYDGSTATSEQGNNANAVSDHAWFGCYVEGGAEFDSVRLHQDTLAFVTDVIIESSTDLGDTWATEMTGTGLTGNTWDTIS